MDIEQIRKDFEAHNEAWIHLYTGNDRREDGEYLSTDLEVAWKDWQAAHAHYAKPAAPVELPGPVAAQIRFIASPPDFWSLCSVEHARAFVGGAYEVRFLYTEQQVRELLATATQVPAQDITEKAAKYDHLLPYLCKTCGGYGLLDRRSNDDPLGSEPCPDCNAAPPPQADARDAERYRWLRQNSRETVDVYINEYYKNMDQLDTAIDAAIAAAKENK